MTERPAESSLETPSNAPAGRVARLRRALAPSFWPLTDQGMVSAANFFTNILIARGLGLYEFGLFTLAWSLVLFAAALQYTLISAPMFTMAPQHEPASQAGYFGAVVAQELAFLALALLLFLVGARVGSLFFEHWDLSGYALALAAAAVAYLAQDFIRRCLFARARQRMALLSDAISYLGQIVLLLVAFQYGVRLEGVLWISAATSALAAVVGLAFIGPLEWRAGHWRESMTQHWRFSRWLLGSQLVQWVSNYTFLLVTATLLGAAAVGGLRAAWLVLAVNNILFLGQENFLPVRAAEVLQRHGRKALQSLMWHWTLLGLGATLAISAVAVAAPQFWIRLFFGDAMLPYADLVYGYAVSFPLTFVLIMAYVILRTGDATHQVFRAASAMAVLGLFVAYPLIAVLGIWGAIVGTILCQMIGLIIMGSGIRQNLAPK
jgi:O-antigen/teichoic acid export membrane protein